MSIKDLLHDKNNSKCEDVENMISVIVETYDDHSPSKIHSEPE